MKFRLLLLGLILIVVFQNCVLSGNSFQFASFAQDEKASDGGGSGGNGTGFEGKPQGTFVRLLPENVCSPLAPAPVEALVLDEKGAHLKVVDNSCVTNAFELSMDDVKYSRHQRYLVSVRDGVYVNGEALAHAQLQPTVAWCRSGQTEREFALTTDQVIWFKGGSEAREPVSSMTMENHILSVNATGWKFKIDAHLGVADLEAFPALIEQAPEGFAADGFSCRLAYSYDGRIWPAQLVLPNLLSGLAKDTLSNKLYFAGAANGDGVIWSYPYADSGSAAPRVVFKQAGLALERVQVSPLGDALAFGTRLTLSEPGRLNHFDLATGNLSLLTPFTVRPDQGIAPAFSFSSSGRGIFYRDGSQFLRERDEKYMMYVDLAGGSQAPLHGNLSADVQPVAFWPLPGAGERVLAAVGFNFSFDFWIFAPGQVPVSLNVKSLIPVGTYINYWTLQSPKSEPVLLPSGRGFFFNIASSWMTPIQPLYYFDIVRRDLRPVLQGSASVIAMSPRDEVLVRLDHRIALLNSNLELVHEWPGALAAQFEAADDSVVVLSQVAETLTLTRFNLKSGQTTTLSEAAVAKLGFAGTSLRKGDLEPFTPGYYLFLADQNLDYFDELYLLDIKNSSLTMINDRYDRYLGVLGYDVSPATGVVYIRQGAFGGFNLFKYELPR